MIVTQVLDNFKVKFVYQVNGIDVAFIIVEDVIDVINIVDVFVEEDYRRKGIASELLKFIFEYFCERDVKFMLEVREDNMPGIRLYEKFGFKCIHVRKKYYKDADAIIMEVSR